MRKSLVFGKGWPTPPAPKKPSKDPTPRIETLLAGTVFEVGTHRFGLYQLPRGARGMPALILEVMEKHCLAPVDRVGFQMLLDAHGQTIAKLAMKARLNFVLLGEVAATGPTVAQTYSGERVLCYGRITCQQDGQATVPLDRPQADFYLEDARTPLTTCDLVVVTDI